MQKAIDYLNIFILITILVLSPWFYGSVDLSQQYFIHLASLFILLVWLVKKNITSKEINFYSAYLPLSLFFIIAFLSILFSVYRYASILGILNLFSYLIIFFITLDTMNNDKRRDLFIWVMMLAGLFYCVYGILQYKGYLPKDFWTQSNSLSSRFVNSSSFSALINISLFLCLGLAFYYKKIIAKTTLFLFSAVFFISLILSNSRISWLTFILSLIIFVLLIYRNISSIKLKGLIFIVLFGIILILAIYFFRAEILWRIRIATETQFQSLMQRFDVWKGTIRIILNYPFGTGIGTFQYIYPMYRIHSDRFFVETAHSDFLQIASEIGIVGLIVFIYFLARVFRSINTMSFMVAGLFCAIFSFALQSLCDFPLYIPANAVFFFSIIGLLTTYTNKSRKISLNKYANIVIIVLVVVSLILFTNIYHANKYYRLAEDDFSKMRWNEAMANYAKAIKSMPIYADAYSGKGTIYSLKAALAFGKQKKEFRKQAISDFKKAANLNPHQSSNYLNLALLYLDEGKIGEAFYVFDKAIENNPTNGEYYYPYADYCLEHRMLDKALGIYHKALSLFISDEGSFARLYGSISGVFDKIYTYTQDYNKLKLVVPDEKLEIRLVFAQFLEAKGKNQEAYTEYQKILIKDPHNDVAQQALIRLSKG